MHPNGCCGHIINDGNGPVKGQNNSHLVPLFGGAVLAVIAVFDIQVWNGSSLFVWRWVLDKQKVTLFTKASAD